MKKLFVLMGLVLGFLTTVNLSASAQNFSEADFEGTWDFIYNYSGYSVVLLGVTTFDATGSLSSGKFLTEGVSFSSGNLSFINTTIGIVSGSLTSITPSVVIDGISGTMNITKNRIDGIWTNSLGSSGTFYTLKRPTGAQNFSIEDFEGTWDFTYYYTGSTAAYTGETTFDNNGKIISGALTTENKTISHGGATFYDWENGNLFLSISFPDDATYYVFDTIDGTMGSSKETINGTWENSLDYSGTFTGSKQITITDSGGGGGGGGGGPVGPLAVGISTLLSWWKRRKQRQE